MCFLFVGKDLFTKAASDSIVKVLLGIELDTMYGTNQEATQFSNAFDVANEMAIYRYADFSWKIKKFLNIGSEAALRKNIKVVDEFVYNLIKSKIETVPNLGDELHNAKICFSDDTWPDGFGVKKGDTVGYNACSMGRMKHLWGDDAEEFRPERWLDENGRFQQESSFKFTAFGAVPRICLGKDFAYKATTIFSAVLLGSCIFKLRDENEVAKYKIKITHHTDGGLYVQASPRL
ncbi:hypothetical protein Pyn_13127 [Prunus yedoensis var. nudiflora]|uniref:Cytochrome P450 704C1 n=1 Tax=Prunus yedoensis var. nudiflora TaxID=2094558 RepID=A0A314YTD3_PRUYE|nr:hypothetical protein Pyn_13127 [Prunus yedoensis var. nudiflora]